MNLVVNAHVKHLDNGLDLVHSCIGFLIRFQSFSATRWCGIGPSMRLFLRARAVGLEMLVQICRDRGVSLFDLKGHDSLTPAALRTMCVAAIGSRPAESFMQEVMDDDRLLRRLAVYKSAFEDELTYMSDFVSDYAWERVAAMGGMPVADLKHSAMVCGLISKAYVHKETFAIIEGEPWCLTQGDIVQNLKGLVAWDSEPRDVVTSRVKGAVASGLVSFERMARALTLVREMPWSTNVVEQSHGSAACLMKFHELYSEQLLAARALVCQMKPLFCVPADQSYEARLRVRLDSVEAKIAKPGPSSSFVAFFTDYSQTT